MLDESAIAIGSVYQSAAAGTDDRVFYLRDVGNRLLKQKEALSHGLWLRWIKDNQAALGFSARVARSLIRGTQWMEENWRLADALEEIVTDPCASPADLTKAAEIRQLISCQFLEVGTLNRRKRNEWYTPQEYISRARAVLGDIDVDPASTELAQVTVAARLYFDKQQNGLRQPWHGRVWLNPPYSQPLIGQFVAKLLMELNAGRATACIALTHNYTDAIWFHDAISEADAACFTQGRVRFYEPGGELAKPTQGQTFFYYGSDVDAFKREFGRVGVIVRPEDQHIRRPR